MAIASPPAPPRPIRVFFLTATSDRGGAETLLAAMLSRLDREAFSCRVASLIGGGWLTARCRAMGIEATTGPPRGWLGGAERFLAVRREMRRFRPHVVHMFGLRAEVWGRPLARWTGTPVVVAAAHSTDPERGAVSVCLDRLTARYVDRFVAVGRAVAATRVARERYPRRKIEILPNGIEPPPEAALAERAAARTRLARELGLPEASGPWLLMVGNLRPMKGHAEAIGAMARWRREFPEVRLLVVGRDASGGRYERLAESLDCARHVVHAGYREDPSPFFAAADLFLMPSYWEGCPTALLEAMAWRLPVVASRIAGVREVARDRREALLVPARDAAALAEAVARLLADPQTARSLAVAARERVLERYTLERMTQRHARLYRDLLGTAESGVVRG